MHVISFVPNNTFIHENTFIFYISNSTFIIHVMRGNYAVDHYIFMVHLAIANTTSHVPQMKYALITDKVVTLQEQKIYGHLIITPSLFPECNIQN